jgi:hypothetical protein
MTVANAAIRINLLTTKYAQSEPSIQAHNIKTYVGKVVCQQQVVGCLSAWYTIEYMPGEIDRKIIDVISSRSLQIARRRKLYS